jgi:hypothetical protein
MADAAAASPLLQLPPQLLVALAAACSPATRRQLRASCTELRAAANAATRGLGLWLHPDSELALALVAACAEGLLALDLRWFRPGFRGDTRWAARLGASCAPGAWGRPGVRPRGEERRPPRGGPDQGRSPACLCRLDLAPHAVQMLQRARHLRRLHLRFMYLSHELLEQVAQLPELASAAFSCCQGLRNTDLVRLAASSSLRSLQLHQLFAYRCGARQAAAAHRAGPLGCRGACCVAGGRTGGAPPSQPGWRSCRKPPACQPAPSPACLPCLPAGTRTCQHSVS